MSFVADWMPLDPLSDEEISNIGVSIKEELSDDVTEETSLTTHVISRKTKKKKFCRSVKADNNNKIMESFTSVHSAWKDVQESSKPLDGTIEMVKGFVKIIREHQPELKSEFVQGSIALMGQISHCHLKNRNFSIILLIIFCFSIIL